MATIVNKLKDFISEKDSTVDLSNVNTIADAVDKLSDLDLGGGGGSSFDLSDRMGKGTADGAVWEGEGSTASGDNSHAEGYMTTASNYGSHAEGEESTASGVDSHAEGAFTVASNDCSHAEGDTTTASGIGSHAEGQSTIAIGNYQHVSGKFNVGDNQNTYAEIVGNGVNPNTRSNARTLDWNGNESLAGSLTLGMNDVNPVTLTANDLAKLLALINNS